MEGKRGEVQRLAKAPLNLNDALVSAFISLMLPGAAQICDGRRAAGFLFMLGVAMWYVLFMPVGWIVHIWNVVDAFTHRMRPR